MTSTKDGHKTDDEMFRKVPGIRIEGGETEVTTHEVIEEVPYALFINGRHAMTAMMSPRQLEDFVTGYLFTEQIIKAPDEIESIKIEKNRMSVITKNLFKVLGPKKTILSGCGGSSSFIDTGKLPSIKSGFTIVSTEISRMTKGILDSELHNITGGIHIVGLVSSDCVITRAEDIGRHNALDRVIGYALRNNIDLSSTCAVCSGRISSEIVRKCLIANIPVIISRSATTTLAIDIAAKNGICIVGFVRGGKMIIYTHPERVQGTPSFSP
ncbi:MAG: formate dehydrogenase accessory sulfurtransferase FdhD [Methanoregula sp.]|nr:formate dehydrogenase accessory sulfurtransferase FdhD [Methanoregula sp.]